MNLRPGPKPKAKSVKGYLCPPGSEAQTVYRGIRTWRRKCKYGGHDKPHPGRCVLCRRESDRARDTKPQRAKQKREAYGRWNAKPGSKAEKSAWAKRRNKRPEQKQMTADRMRKYYWRDKGYPESLGLAITTLNRFKRAIRKKEAK